MIKGIFASPHQNQTSHDDKEDKRSTCLNTQKVLAVQSQIEKKRQKFSEQL